MNSPAVLLAALRSVGGAAFLAPTLGAKTFGIPDDAEGTYLVRLFAARNLAFTAGLLASRGRARRRFYEAGLVCDVLDAAAGVLGFRDGKKRSSAIVDTSASLVAATLGAAGLFTDPRAKEA